MYRFVNQSIKTNYEKIVFLLVAVGLLASCTSKADKNAIQSQKMLIFIQKYGIKLLMKEK